MCGDILSRLRGHRVLYNPSDSELLSTLVVVEFIQERSHFIIKPKYVVAFVSMINCRKINFFVYVRVSFIVPLPGPRQQSSSYHAIHSSRLTTKLSKRL